MSAASKTVTVGYRYYLGLHFGMCHGPVDSVEQIQVGERLAWSGNQTASGSISINSPELFGGESKEGGIQGTLDVMMGEPTQGTNGYLTAQQGTPQPAYRGILGLVYRGGLIACNNPYVKPWGMRVRRVLKGWHGDQVWYSGKASINVGSGVTAANPAHIIYECLTNPSWGMGYPSSLIDNSSFQTAADAFHSEGLGLCLAWSQQDSLDNFIQLVLDHAGAVLSQDSGGGYFKLKALRGDYVPGTLDLFDDSNGKVISLEKIERTTYTENVNEIAIQYIDATNGRNASIYVQNLSNVQAQGAVVNQTRQYHGIPNANLAARIGMRDLKAMTSGLARITFVANRSAFHLVPGDVIRFAWQPAGISSMSLRITRIDYGPLTSGLIRIEGLEDVFGLPATVYADPPPIAWTPPNYTPQAAGYVDAQEATYRDLYSAFGSTISNLGTSEGFIGALATRPLTSVSFNYQLQTKAGAAAYENRVLGDWAPTGTLVDGISKTATSITLQSAFDLDAIVVNTLAMLGSGTNAEIVQVTAVNLGTYTLTIKRGCVDTVPKEWASGTRFVGYELHAANDEIEYTSGEAVSARFLTKTATGTLAEGSAPVATVTMSQRAARPYPPGLVRFNGLAWPASIENSVIVTWAHRDRLLQMDQVLDQEAASAGPEAATTYRARVIDADTSAVLIDQTGIITPEFAWGGGGSGNRTIEIRSVRDSLDSWQSQSHTFAYTSVQLPWTPANISGLMGWFDADDATTVTMSGANVTQWNDKSGRGMHADAPTTTKPTRAVASLSGRTTIAFGGSAIMRLNYTTSGVAATTASGTFRNKTAGSMIVLYRSNPADTTAVGRIIVGFGGGTGTTANRFSMRVNDVSANIGRITTKRLDADAEATLTGSTNRSTNWTIFGGSIDWTNNDAWMYENGVLANSSTAHGTAGSTSDTNSVWSAIGGYMSAATTGGSQLRGNIAEIIIDDQVWDTDTRQRLEGYLAWKWGTVASLPIAHPWKHQPPAQDYVRTSTSNATLSASGAVT